MATIDFDRNSWGGGRPRALVSMTVALCALAMVAEGFDTYSIGFVVPMIMRQWGTTPLAIGFLLGAGVMISAVGSMGIGLLADRFGRKRCLIGTLLCFGLTTVLTGWATNVGMLAVIRSIASLALGASVPLAVALGSDAAPAGRKATVAAMMSASIAIGIVAASLSAAAVVTRLGWPALMTLGGGFAIVLATACMALLQDFASQPHGMPAAQNFGVLIAHPQYRWLLAVSLVALTAIFMATFFFNFWLPTLLTKSHATIRQAALIAALAQSTSIIGAFATGRAMDRYGLNALALSFAATAIVLIGAMILSQSLVGLMIGMTVLCLFLNGVFGGAIALPVRLFPADMRASAAGLTIGGGRLIGGTVGPLLGGWLMGSDLPYWWIAAAFAPALLAASLMLFICQRRRATGSIGTFN